MVLMSGKDIGNRVRGLVSDARGRITGDSLQGKVIRNAGWVGIGYGADMAVRFASSLILTRLLDPSAFGLITTVTVFLMVAVMVSDLGVQTLILTDSRADDEGFLGTLFTIHVIRGFILTIVLALVAFGWYMALQHGMIPPSSSYADPLLPQLLGLLSFTLLLQGFSSLNEHRMIRHLDRGPIARLDIVLRIGTTILNVLLVWLFRSVWMIAITMVVQAVARTVLTHIYLTGPKMTFRIDWKEIKGVLLLSRWVAVNSALYVAASSADKLVIGAGFDLDTLGVYSIAFTLFSSAVTLIEKLQAEMGIPVLNALLEKPADEMKRAYYKFRLPMDLYCAVAGLGMVLLGPLFFRIAYPANYGMGGAFLALLGIKVILMPILLSGNFIYARRRYRLMSFIGLLRTGIYITALLTAVWLQSIHLAVFIIALEKVPEIALYFAISRTGIPFSMRRDGLLIGLAAASILYLSII
ncbi:MAG: oligosaccharide flippase family protein [Sphingobium sp.]|nr:oligosaccharide flippase family protein [Sphingobium sp.]